MLSFVTIAHPCGYIAVVGFIFCVNGTETSFHNIYREIFSETLVKLFTHYLKQSPNTIGIFEGRVSQCSSGMIGQFKLVSQIFVTQCSNLR